MPKVLELKYQTLFHAQDTRLPTGHPIVTKRVDVTDLYPEFATRLVYLDYGYDGVGSCCVEIGIYKPNDLTHWMRPWFSVNDVNKLQCRSEINRIADILRTSPEDLIELIRTYAPQAA